MEVVTGAAPGSRAASPDSAAQHRPGAVPKLRLRGVTKVFQGPAGEVPAVENITLDIMGGEFLCLVGPSGCGKTTLLRILAGLEKQTCGTVEIHQAAEGRPLSRMVFQENSILPWLTVQQNVGYGLAMRGVPRREQQEVVGHYLEMIGLRRFATSYPHQLSGGMKQRVSVARAFADDPEILLMDEPFAALDEQNRLLLQQELLRIWEGTQKTVVFITHSIDEAINLGDRILVMTAQPGRAKALLDVPLARPRDVTETRSDPRAGRLYLEVWRQLRDEVGKAKASEALRRGAPRLT
ncbi:MAG: ABC transporter ATP-binding protein [Symbiobacteriia bacterium]